MGEQSPESMPVNSEVHVGGEDTPPQSLREELLAMFPERCRNGDGSLYQRGMVCEVLTLYVDNCIETAAVDDEARATVAKTAENWEEVCVTGPRNYATTTLLKCGVAADNFFPYRR